MLFLEFCNDQVLQAEYCDIWSKMRWSGPGRQPWWFHYLQVQIKHIL